MFFGFHFQNLQISSFYPAGGGGGGGPADGVYYIAKLTLRDAKVCKNTIPHRYDKLLEKNNKMCVLSCSIYYSFH